MRLWARLMRPNKAYQWETFSPMPIRDTLKVDWLVVFRVKASPRSPENTRGAMIISKTRLASVSNFRNWHRRRLKCFPIFHLSFALLISTYISLVIDIQPRPRTLSFHRQKKGTKFCDAHSIRVVNRAGFTGLCASLCAGCYANNTTPSQSRTTNAFSSADVSLSSRALIALRASITISSAIVHYVYKSCFFLSSSPPPFTAYMHHLMLHPRHNPFRYICTCFFLCLFSKGFGALRESIRLSIVRTAVRTGE